MKILRLLGLSACGAALAIAAACGDDEALVRERVDGGFTAIPDAALACGVELPSAYTSAAFNANAAAELGLRLHFVELETKARATEGASDAGLAAGELQAIYNAGDLSLRAVSTTETQTAVDGWLAAYEAAIGKTWTPAMAEQDGGAPSGGKYGAYHVSANGLDLREATAKALLGGALYRRVLGLVASPVTDATVDSLLAAFGADPTLISDPNARDGLGLLASFASRRDDRASSMPGSYRKMRTALLTMKAAIAGGAKCDADRAAAVATFLLEWERATFATAIFFLNAAVTEAADPAKGPEALHAYAQGLGLIQGFKGLSTRKISDAQIDLVLGKIGADAPYKLVTSPGERALKLNEAISDIALYEGFSAADVEAFRKDF